MTMANDEVIFTLSPDETEAIGRRLGAQLRGGEMIILTGELGMGKTVFFKGMAKGLGWFCLFHQWLAGTGMFLLAKKWSGNETGAWIAGMGFGMGGLLQNSLM